MRPAVLATGEAAGWQAMTGLDHTARTGQPAFDAQQAAASTTTSLPGPLQGGSSRSSWPAGRPALPRPSAVLDFTGSAVVADIGGGHGVILAAVLAAWPQLHGILADRPDVLDGACGHLAAAGVHDRVRLAACDYLDPGQIPRADTYLLTSVLHNHDDDGARAILANILAAATGRPRVLLAEILLPDDPAPHIGYDLDIRMMALGTGRERSRAAYHALLSAPG